MSLPVALITGASSGIGLATARRLSLLGFHIALAGRDKARLKAAADSLAGPSSIFIADLESGSAAEGLVDACVAKHARLDALVNNAGWSPSATIPQSSAAQIKKIFKINAIAPAATIARAWPTFVHQATAEKRPGGVVVNVSSIATVDPFPILYAYAAAKAAVNNLAKSVAIQGRPYRIRGFAVAPGAVETDLLRSLVPESQLPTNKTLDPADVAEVIAACIQGKRDNENGSTIFLPSPA